MKILNLFLLFILFPLFLFSQTEDPPLTTIELAFWNLSTSNTAVKFKVYPVSMVFNGDYKYNLVAFNQSYPDPYTVPYGFINGRNLYEYEWTLQPNQFTGLNHDKSPYYSSTVGCVGFGVYKIEVWKYSNNVYVLIDTCTVEYDAGYPGVFSADLSIYYRDDINGIGGSGPRITYYWGSGCTEQNINVVGK